MQNFKLNEEKKIVAEIDMLGRSRKDLGQVTYDFSLCCTCSTAAYLLSLLQVILVVIATDSVDVTGDTHCNLSLLQVILVVIATDSVAVTGDTRRNSH